MKSACPVLVVIFARSPEEELDMRRAHYQQLADQLQRQVVDLLLHQLQPPDYSRTCTAWLLLSCLVLAAVQRFSLTAVATVRKGCPSRETLRRARQAILPDYDTTRRRLPCWLQATLPRGLRRHRRHYPMALDLHRVAYFKRHRTPPAHVRKGQRLAGTRYAHDYATLALLRKGQYYVVAATPVDAGEDWAGLVRRLVRQAAGHGFPPRYLLLDRSFWSADVFRYLQRARLPFTLPVQGRGKTARAAGGPTGTQVFFYRRRSERTTYTVRNRAGQSATVSVVVLRQRRADRRGRRCWVYAQWGMRYAHLRWVQESYRRRFRIESSYRLLETGRGRTSSRDEGLRLWWVLLAVLLVNVWLTLRRTATRRWGTGQRGGVWYNRLVALVAQQLLEQTAPSDPPATKSPTPQVVTHGDKNT
jgi:hypothetical protein